MEEDSNSKRSKYDEAVVKKYKKFVGKKELKKLNYTVVEKTISESELLDAEEVFLTNSIYNFKWVESIEDKKFENRTIQTIYHDLVKTNSLIFC